MTGTLSFLLYQSYQPAHLDSGIVAGEVSRFKSEFQTRTKASFELDFDELKKQVGLNELIEPRNTLPQLVNFPHQEISNLVQYAESCDPKIPLTGHLPALKKAILWQQFVCKKVKILPRNFFKTVPLMHPSGSSYARLAELQGLSVPKESKHLLEILNEEHRDSHFAVNAISLKSILKAEDSVVTQNHLLLLKQGPRGEDGPRHYLAYELGAWNHFMQGKKFVPNLLSDPGMSPALCWVQDGDLCWIVNPEKQNSKSRRLALLLLAGVVILTISLLVLLRNRLMSKKQEEEQRLFALQMLTHELRTPATAMRLAIETQRREFDSLPTESQKAFLQMCDEFQRFQKIIDASKNYLKSQNDPRPSMETVPSINDFTASILEQYQDRITFQPLTEDRSFPLNRYWLELCLKNLVDNALIHGKQPVVVSLSGASGLKIVVSDQGEFSVNPPSEIMQSKEGLGLGLVIVKKVVQGMGGELFIQNSPTRVTIELKAGK